MKSISISAPSSELQILTPISVIKSYTKKLANHVVIRNNRLSASGAQTSVTRHCHFLVIRFVWFMLCPASWQTRLPWQNSSSENMPYWVCVTWCIDVILDADNAIALKPYGSDVTCLPIIHYISESPKRSLDSCSAHNSALLLLLWASITNATSSSASAAAPAAAAAAAQYTVVFACLVENWKKTAMTKTKNCCEIAFYVSRWLNL